MFLSITSPLREIHRILDEAHESSIKVNDLYVLLNEPLDMSFIRQHRKIGEKRINKLIAIKNLSFLYSGRKENALNNISIDIRKGEKIGIVGASGCGKTTLIKIILKLLHSYKGKVFVFGRDLKQITREEIATKIAYVPQKTYIFSGTVKENIIYGVKKKHISNEKIIIAAKKANLYHEIINNLGGFEGKISENGNNLSGGQKQRLAIARVILQSAELLIFDEATSALDNSNESSIQREIESIFKNKTMIIIAHRLTTLRNTNRVVVFDKGRIIQDGTYDELAKQEGKFKTFLYTKNK